jgi:hypothetical protein
MSEFLIGAGVLYILVVVIGILIGLFDEQLFGRRRGE